MKTRLVAMVIAVVVMAGLNSGSVRAQETVPVTPAPDVFEAAARLDRGKVREQALQNLKYFK